MDISGKARQALTEAHGLALDAIEILKDGSKQNRWVEDYIAPLITIDAGKMKDNYSKNREASFLEKMESAGVNDSLQRLEKEGTSWDRVCNPIVSTVMADFERHQLHFIYGVGFPRRQLEMKQRHEDIGMYSLPIGYGCNENMIGPIRFVRLPDDQPDVVIMYTDQPQNK